MQKYLYISKIIEIIIYPLRLRPNRYASFAMINIQLIMHKYLLNCGSGK